MEYRFITQTEESLIKKLWAYCFEPEDHPFFQWYFSRYYSPQNVLAGFEGDSLLCCLHLNPYTLELRGASFPTSYIVGVATAPEGRSQRSIGGLLTEGLAEMRRRGQAVAILMPFKGVFYYPYGFEFCYHSLQYDVDLGDLKALSAGRGRFAPFSPDHFADLQAIYTAFTSGMHGYVQRDEISWRHLWEEHQVDKGAAYIYWQDERPAGYIFYNLAEDALQVKEMAYIDQEAEAALLRFCYNHRSQVSRLKWLAPLDDGLLFSLPDPKTGVTLYPFMTGRIVDAVMAFNQAFYPQAVTSSLVLEVTDSLAPWNTGRFRLTVQNGKGKALATDEPSDCRLSCGALAQLFFGRVSAARLQKMGRLTADVAVVAQLDQCFPTCLNYINEYY